MNKHRITIRMIKDAAKKYAYYKKHNLPIPPIPTHDIWGNELPKPPTFPAAKISAHQELNK